MTSTFWVVTQPLPTAERATIPNLKEDRQGFHMAPKIEVFDAEMTVCRFEVIVHHFSNSSNSLTSSNSIANP